MIKFGFFLLCLPCVSFGMEDKAKEQMMNLYKKDILPHMPAYTRVTEESGITTLERLAQTNFDSKRPLWTFNHTLTWIKVYARDADAQVDIVILKRYIAAIIDRANVNSNLRELGDQLLQDKDSLRWIVVGDANSAVSDARIQERWGQFIGTLSESVPVEFDLQ
ncbi:hypothetical protein BH09DEP1_BH09DEP1_4050 [soil metagenome]